MRQSCLLTEEGILDPSLQASPVGTAHRPVPAGTLPPSRARVLVPEQEAGRLGLRQIRAVELMPQTKGICIR